METVSINYDDFNESFLTCSTCLCRYDGVEHCPKLLACSHTVCISCLKRIIATDGRELGFRLAKFKMGPKILYYCFRCPICRELIRIPTGGVMAFPPSFLVNQLIDLMAKQIREVIPNCSVHNNQELMFCETCDLVFCLMCVGGSHNSVMDNSNMEQLSISSPASNRHSIVSYTSQVSGSISDHTVIPLSVARKRMSEIVIYKANECSTKVKCPLMSFSYIKYIE